LGRRGVRASAREKPQRRRRTAARPHCSRAVEGGDMRRILFSSGLIAALVGGAGLVIAWPLDPKRASYSYLFAFTYVFTIVIGALFLLMIGHACDARWFVAVRRYAEHVVGATPILGALVIPILAFMKQLYPWTDLSRLSSHDREIVAKKVAYLNVPFFVLRT